jgi:hypothetical protein
MNMRYLKASLVLGLLAGLSVNIAAQQTPAAASQPVESSATAALPPPGDAREIMRRAVEIDNHNFERARNYTGRRRAVQKHLDKHGQVQSTEIRTYEITFLSGEPYSRLIEKDDRPLGQKERQKEEEKIEKFIAKRRDESQQEREKRLAKQEKERREGRLFLRDAANAFDFKLVGEEQIEGHGVYVIDATPRPDFHPTQPHADLLSKVRGRVWIEKENYNWVKAEIETIDTISFGLFLARIHQGSRLMFEQTRVNDEVWLVHRFALSASVRLALLKNEAIELEDIFSDYHKFSTGTRILGIKTVEDH